MVKGSSFKRAPTMLDVHAGQNRPGQLSLSHQDAHQGADLINDVYRRNREEAEEEAWWADESESIESINTIAAWCLIPNLERAYASEHQNAGHFSRFWMWTYMIGGVFFTFMQAFIVTRHARGRG